MNNRRLLLLVSLLFVMVLSCPILGEDSLYNQPFCEPDAPFCQ